MPLPGTPAGRGATWGARRPSVVSAGVRKGTMAPGAPTRAGACCRAAAAGPRPLALVTGASGGIGLETVRGLRRAGCDVVLACRPGAKADGAFAQLLGKEGGGTEVYLKDVDMGSLATIEALGAEMRGEGRAIDVLVNNAGVMATPEMLTADGFEYQLGINHLGHFKLTSELFELLAADARIVNVSSTAHEGGRFNAGDPFFREPGSYAPWTAYGQSKLANVLFTYELVRRLPAGSQVTANALHPGFVATDLFKFSLPGEGDLPPALRQAGEALVGASGRLLKALPGGLAELRVKSPAEGAETSIHVASSAECEGVTGKYFVGCKATPSNLRSYDLETAAALWEFSEQQVGPFSPAPAKAVEA